MFAGPIVPPAHHNTDDSEFLTGEPISKPELIRQLGDTAVMTGSDNNIVVADCLKREKMAMQTLAFQRQTLGCNPAVSVRSRLRRPLKNRA